MTNKGTMTEALDQLSEREIAFLMLTAIDYVKICMKNGATLEEALAESNTEEAKIEIAKRTAQILDS